MNGELVADIIGIVIIIWGVIALIGALGQFGVVLSSGFKAALFIPLMSFLIGVVAIVGGYFITGLG